MLKKFDLASLKAQIDKIDIDRLETISLDLSKLIDVVKNEVDKKDECNELFKNLMLFRLLIQVI